MTSVNKGQICKNSIKLLDYAGVVESLSVLCPTSVGQDTWGNP